MTGGVTVKDVNALAFIEKYAQHLKRQGKMEIPKWVDIVKTANHKELAPYNADWYFIRAAAVARKVYLRPHTGVGALTKWFGGKKRNGSQTEHFNTANGGLLRHILQQLESIKVLEKSGKGRIITRIGQQDLDRIAGQLQEEQLAAKTEDDEAEEDDASESSESSEESSSEEEDSD